ncbi:MAG: helicase-related protein [Thermodesulfobacteriota bacterium]
MPRVFDNIENALGPALRETMKLAAKADFCVGYFNLRGWRLLDSCVEDWSGGSGPARLLVGMQKPPQEELKEALSLMGGPQEMDNQTAIRIKKSLAEEFRQQLSLGVPTNEDEATLRRLAAQIRNKKVQVKLFLRHQLHAKLYLLFRPDPVNPIVGYMGSSNLTFSGLAGQGELNIDVLDLDACRKLAQWFEDRWNDRFCLDISEELAGIIESSWARTEPVPPYHIYIKMAYHLSQEARAGLSEFRIPRDFGNKLFDFQVAAVKIAAHHLNKRGGVLIGDVVGLGKTLMATALARIFEDDHGLETLILCPKNLTPMWEDYKDQYRLRAKVLSLSRVLNELPDLRRYRLVLLDESHNLRNREGKRYRAIQEYIRANDSRCILLSATPYNKTYLDLSNQLRLFVAEDRDLGLRPERLLRDLGETEFIRRHQCPVRSLAAFEKSEYTDDWRDLMRLYLVRRTRGFIQANYAETDPATGRKFLIYEDGTRSFFPDRVPRTVRFSVVDQDPSDQYAQLYSPVVVEALNDLFLPRYGLGNYEARSPQKPPTPTETRLLQDLSRAGKRLMGFCRINLFKRLESCGAAFLRSLERHVLRNYVFLYAIENDRPLPIGAQSAELLDPRFNDEDSDPGAPNLFDDDDNGDGPADDSNSLLETDFMKRAAEIYELYSGPLKNRFNWLRPDLFVNALTNDLRRDIEALLNILHDAGPWHPTEDAKLEALYQLLASAHAQEKVLVFTQFADTVRYLTAELKSRGLTALEGVTGATSDPTEIAWRFSPFSNKKRDHVFPRGELRIIVSTDVLSEGQNLQDAAIVVNFDLPWAIIRLVQRAGRVDRIGQKSKSILCYSFLPADGVERIIKLRARVRKRLREQAEVVGTDEAFFEGDSNEQAVVDLYNENAGILDGEDDTEVDLASQAYQIWKNAVEQYPGLQKTIPELPDVVYSSRLHQPSPGQPEGVLVYLRTGEGNDALAYLDSEGRSITESQPEILKMAECTPGTPAAPRHEKHHDLVAAGVRHIVREEKRVGGALGRPSGARFRTYERLKNYAESLKGTLFESPELLRAIDDIYRYPLRQSAVDILNRQLRSGIDDVRLTELVISLREEDRLCFVEQEGQHHEPRLICSLGLFNNPKAELRGR